MSPHGSTAAGHYRADVSLRGSPRPVSVLGERSDVSRPHVHCGRVSSLPNCDVDDASDAAAVFHGCGLSRFGPFQANAGTQGFGPTGRGRS
jgi:hypothetical protein